jgi:hypothetical protein
VITNFASWQNYDAAPQPHISPDDDWSRVYRAIRFYAMPIGIEHGSKVADLSIVADFDIAGRYNASPLINKNTITDLKLRFRRGSSEFTGSGTTADH